MWGRIRSFVLFLLVLVFLLSPFSAFGSDPSSTMPFRDVKTGTSQGDAVNALYTARILKDSGNHLFEPNKVVLKLDFLVWLIQVMKWQLVKPAKPSFVNIPSGSKYFQYVETAVAHGIMPVPGDRKLNTGAVITREDAAVMLVKAMGQEPVAQKLAYLGQPFKDVTSGMAPYIHIVRDFGLMDGKTAALFRPKTPMTRGEAAISLARLYEKWNAGIKELHAFYAAPAAHQMDKIKALSSVSFAWSRVQYDAVTGNVVLNTTTKNKNEFYIPSEFQSPMLLAQSNNVTVLLNVFADQSRITTEQYPQGIGLVDYILASQEIRRQVMDEIIKQLELPLPDGTGIQFDGVVIDFEGLRGAASAQNLNLFLKELKQEMGSAGKKLYTAVNPKRGNNQPYFDGYDYKTIGELSDRVILMAHDYDAKRLTEQEMKSGYTTTPLTPIDEIYFALRAITDKSTGVQNREKIWLQVSFSAVQWTFKDKVLTKNIADIPFYSSIAARFADKEKTKDLSVKYSEALQNPYATFTDTKLGLSYKLWYEDSRSILAKIRLARMFGINGLSLWRIGNIPDYEDVPGGNKVYLDVWQRILEER